MPYNIYNENVYLNMHADVRAAVQQGLIVAREHFEQWGKSEGRMASYLFNPHEYLQMNPDVAHAVAQGWMNVYQHFESHGVHEGRAPFSAFDASYYLQQNPDVAAAVDAGVVSAVQHFLLHGQHEARNFNPGFDVPGFLAANPEAAAAVEAGLFSPAELVLQHYSAADESAWVDELLDWADGVPVAGADADADLGPWLQQLADSFQEMGEETFDVTRLEQLLLESGLIGPGAGEVNPQDIVDLIWTEYYGSPAFDLNEGWVFGM